MMKRTVAIAAALVLVMVSVPFSVSAAPVDLRPLLGLGSGYQTYNRSNFRVTIDRPDDSASVSMGHGAGIGVASGFPTLSVGDSYTLRVSGTSSRPLGSRMTITVLGVTIDSNTSPQYFSFTGTSFSFTYTFDATVATGWLSTVFVYTATPQYSAYFTYTEFSLEQVGAPVSTYTITPSAGSGGSISPASAQTVQQGGSQAFTITPNSGYRVKDVLVNGSSVGAVSSYTFSNVQANGTIAATFEPIPPNTFVIQASVGAGGSISPSGAVSVTQGGSQAFTITPNSGYRVADVLVNGSSVGAVASYTFSNVQANGTIAASFEAEAPSDVLVFKPSQFFYTIEAYNRPTLQGYRNIPGSVYYSIADGNSRDIRLMPVVSDLNFPREGMYTIEAIVLATQKDVYGYGFIVDGLPGLTYEKSFQGVQMIFNVVIEDMSQVDFSDGFPFEIWVLDPVFEVDSYDNNVGLNTFVITKIEEDGPVGDWGIFTPLIVWMNQFFGRIFGVSEDSTEDAINKDTELNETTIGAYEEMDRFGQSLDGVMEGDTAAGFLGFATLFGSVFSIMPAWVIWLFTVVASVSIGRYILGGR